MAQTVQNGNGITVGTYRAGSSNLPTPKAHSAWSASSNASAGRSLASAVANQIQNGSGTASSASGVSGGFSGNAYSMLQGISDANNAFNLDQVNMVNAFNAAEAQKNRDWQERMSNTAHQREVKDLIAAGLNPVLSAFGQGAVTGSGAVASGQKAVADNTVGNGLISLMSAMISASSAQSVAQIYANASMYGADTSAKTQAEYQKTLKEINRNSNITQIVNSAVRLLPGFLAH